MNSNSDNIFLDVIRFQHLSAWPALEELAAVRGDTWCYAVICAGAEANLENFAVPAMARIAKALKERHPEVQDEHRRAIANKIK